MDTKNADPEKLVLWKKDALFLNTVGGCVEVMQEAYDALFAYARPCIGTDGAIMALRSKIDEVSKLMDEVGKSDS